MAMGCEVVEEKRRRRGFVRDVGDFQFKELGKAKQAKRKSRNGEELEQVNVSSMRVDSLYSEYEYGGEFASHRLLLFN
jgi:hypothetical protein